MHIPYPIWGNVGRMRDFAQNKRSLWVLFSSNPLPKMSSTTNEKTALNLLSKSARVEALNHSLRHNDIPKDDYL